MAPLTIKVKGLVRALAICKENQTILECGNEVILHSQREKAEQKGLTGLFASLRRSRQAWNVGKM